MMQPLHSAAEDHPSYLLQRNLHRELFTTVQILLVSSSLKAILKGGALQVLPVTGGTPGSCSDRRHLRVPGVAQEGWCAGLVCRVFEVSQCLSAVWKQDGTGLFSSQNLRKQVSFS